MYTVQSTVQMRIFAATYRIGHLHQRQLRQKLKYELA